MKCNFITSFSSPHATPIKPQRFELSANLRNLSPSFQPQPHLHHLSHNYNSTKPRQLQKPDILHTKQSSVFEELDVQTSQSLIIDQRPQPPPKVPKLVKVQTTGLPFTQICHKQRVANNHQDQLITIVSNLKKTQNLPSQNFVTLGELTLSDKPPTMSSQSSQDMNQFTLTNQFVYSIQSSKEKANLKKITEEDSNSLQPIAQDQLSSTEQTANTKLQQIFLNIFSKQNSISDSDTSVDKKIVALSLATGKDNQNSGRYTESPNKPCHIVPSVKKVHMQSIHDDQDKVDATNSFNPSQYQQTFEKCNSANKMMQTSLQNENTPPEPEISIPLMHTQESRNKNEVMANKINTMKAKKLKSQTSNSTTTFFQSLIMNQFSNSSKQNDQKSHTFVEELEGNNLKLSLFKEPNGQQIIFTGMTKNLTSQINKEQLCIDLYELFNQCSKPTLDTKNQNCPKINQYIRIDNLEQSIYNSQKQSNSESLHDNFTLPSNISVQNSSVHTKEELVVQIKNAQSNDRLIAQKEAPSKFNKKKQVTPIKENIFNKSSFIKSLQSQNQTFQKQSSQTKKREPHMNLDLNMFSPDQSKKEKQKYSKFSVSQQKQPQPRQASVKQTSAKQISAKQVSGKQVSAKQVAAKQVSAKSASATTSAIKSYENIKNPKNAIMNSVKDFSHSIYDEKQFRGLKLC